MSESKIKFSVGLPVVPVQSFTDTVIKNTDRISEVYFSFGDFPNGRSAPIAELLYEHTKKQLQILDTLNSHDLNFNLLFNATCYGSDSQSRSFFCKIGDTVDYISKVCNLTSVTTTSPLIAKFIKENFRNIKVRASVNSEIGTTQGMEYISEYFDGFYMKREHNRNLGKIKELSCFCHRNGKEIYMLANSGCLNYCSAHVFHDNLVSHESEIAKADNAYNFTGICREFLSERANRERYFEITNFVRPEDVGTVAEYFDGIKLATRISPDPITIIESYIRGKYSGNIPALLEPNHSALFYPEILRNGKVPNDYMQTVLHCEKRCEECQYCKNIYSEISLRTEDISQR